MHSVDFSFRRYAEVSVDILCAMHDCALGISPVTSYSGVTDWAEKQPHRSCVESELAVERTAEASAVSCSLRRYRRIAN